MRTVARLAVAGLLVLSLAGCTALGQASRDLARRFVEGGGGTSSGSGSSGSGSSGSGSSGDGSSSDGSGTDWTDLRVGDCFDDSDDDYTVPLRDCAKHHDNEVYALLTEPGGAYPGDVVVDKWARANCQTALEQYDGIAFLDSTLDFSYSTPAAENWDAGDQVTICYAYDWNYDQLVGSVKGKKL